MEIKQNVLMKKFKIINGELVETAEKINDKAMVFRTKDEKLVDLKKFENCIIWIFRTKINQDIEIYKKIEWLK